MIRISQKLISGVVGPAQSANDRGACRKNELLGVGHAVCELQTKTSEQFIGIFNLKVVILLVAHDDQPAPLLDKASDHIDVFWPEMVRLRISFDSLVAWIGDHDDLYAGQRSLRKLLCVGSHIKMSVKP